MGYVIVWEKKAIIHDGKKNIYVLKCTSFLTSFV